MTVSIYQQNKNKFNRLSALLTAETKKISKIYLRYKLLEKDILIYFRIYQSDLLWLYHQ